MEYTVDRLPLEQKGSLSALMSWLYHRDEWAKAQPIFEPLPSRGMMDYAFYPQIISDAVFSGLPRPALTIARTNNTASDDSAGLLLAEYHLGQRRFLYGTLLTRESRGSSPVADRLLLNMLCHAAANTGGPA